MEEGYVCIASTSKLKGFFQQKFFKWPESMTKIDSYVSGLTNTHDIWFCTSLLERPERIKETCLAGSLVWADLDYVPVTDKLDEQLPPSCLVQSSPGRYQAYWRLEKKVPPEVQEDFSRRVAYFLGADKSGWDLTQLLRVPYTHNMKYPLPHPQITIEYVRETLAPVELFDELPDTLLVANDTSTNGSLPKISDLPDAKSVIYSYRHALNEVEGFSILFAQEPQADADWSKLLWRLINICVEVGMTAEETFAIAIEAKCNKYARDNRPLSYLWREVIKASLNHDALTILTSKGYETLEMPQLVDPDGIEEDSLVKDYKEWGDVATDAPFEYHELSSFIALSALIAGGVKLPTSFGELVPNLWGLILGESTLTRKTTAMRMAMDIVTDIDDEAILATDGSPEGLLTGLSMRPSRTSIFYKDEVSGFFDSINRKDYLAGLPETLTQLYDVPKILQRLLRKDTITIQEPYFIFFGGGIRDKVYSLVKEEYVLSGFLPRFLVVSSSTDMDRLRRTGPPTPVSDKLKERVINHMVELKQQYSLSSVIEVGGQQMVNSIKITAKMKDPVWSYFGDLEMALINVANDSAHAMVALPTFQRLAFSLLKMATLIGASRRPPNKSNELWLEKDDLKQAAWYIQRWGRHSIDLITHAGTTVEEGKLQRVILFVGTNQGCKKSDIMNKFHFSAKEAREILETLTERGRLVVRKSGKTTRLFTIV